MSIGYACLAIGAPNTDLKSCILKNVSEEKLMFLISYNLNSLENIIDYNIKNNIKLFRMTSDLIPFGSSPANTLQWWELFSSELARIGKKIQASGMRVSMHPGQYTVLNSPNVDVVNRAIDDLEYHTKVLDSLGVEKNHKIVLHIGGVYGDKKLAISRFMINYSSLDESVKNRLVIENDDRSYNIKDVLEIGIQMNIPVICDNLHNEINPYSKEKDIITWINECKKTWNEKDGYQKIHYSQQDTSKRAGAHSSTIDIEEFLDFYERLGRKDIDIMLEVKDKNLSALKCINCTSRDKRINDLEIEWSKYKYKVLESCPSHYIEIRKLLKDKNEYPAIEMYKLIEDAMKKEIIIGISINAALHVFGYFKKSASDKERISFLKSIEEYRKGALSNKAIKNKLWKMTVKYEQSYLFDSYYFTI
ncbi:UV DNA damage repair endonuclease UvsE [Clostridium vincentii]|uniref:UV DNA damage endonuclease n=1 Tax=Clostridium vincentii TaxID=52704 RepID=A0A2T0BCX4_9CLOT|nr:UV DNA damage repair endonuclease UvsE [Clostridium vincentii]PRR81692.1 UV DNA damage endonuclease [Clostridium vincentii]